MVTKSLALSFNRHQSLGTELRLLLALLLLLLLLEPHWTPALGHGVQLAPKLGHGAFNGTRCAGLLLLPLLQLQLLQQALLLLLLFGVHALA